MKELFLTIMTKLPELIVNKFCFLCLFLSSCFHTVKGKLLEPTLRCQLNELGQINEQDGFLLNTFVSICVSFFMFLGCQINKYTRLLCTQEYSFMKFAQNNYPTLLQGVPSIGTHFRFQFLTFLIVISKKSNYAILTQMV